MLIFTDIKFSHPCLSTTLAMSMASCGFILSFYVFLSCPLPVSCTLSCITKCQNAVKYFGVRLMRFQWAVGKDRHHSSSTPTNLTSHQGMRSITEELYPEWEQQQCCFLSLSGCEVQVLITPLLWNWRSAACTLCTGLSHIKVALMICPQPNELHCLSFPTCTLKQGIIWESLRSASTHTDEKHTKN